MSVIDSNNQYSGQITIGITGASGTPYAVELIKQLVSSDIQVFVISRRTFF